MLTHPIFIRLDSELIRESVCACAKLLLMKKISDVQKSNRGRTKTLTDSTRKRHKKEDSAKYNRTRVSIGDEYDRWTELKDVIHPQLFIAVITRCSANFGTAADS